MKQILLIVLLYVFVVLIVGCRDDKKSIEDNLISMKENCISLDVSKMYRLHSKRDTFHINQKIKGKRYHYIIYVDSTQCSSCAIDGMHKWNTLIDSVILNDLDIDFVFIVAPERWQLDDVYTAIENSGLKNDIYVDTLQIFNELNPNLPKETIFHNFVIDKDNTVVLVGDVLQNTNIRNLLNNLLTSK